jgi:hypothetical protein
MLAAIHARQHQLIRQITRFVANRSRVDVSARIVLLGTVSRAAGTIVRMRGNNVTFNDSRLKGFT